MNTFKNVLNGSGVINDDGVVVNVNWGKGYTSYEVSGICYLIPKEAMYDGIKYVDYIDPSHPHLGSDLRPKVSKKLIDQMRKDIALAYEALGLEYVLL